MYLLQICIYPWYDYMFFCWIFLFRSYVTQICSGWCCTYVLGWLYVGIGYVWSQRNCDTWVMWSIRCRIEHVGLTQCLIMWSMRDGDAVHPSRMMIRIVLYKDDFDVHVTNAGEITIRIVLNRRISLPGPLYTRIVYFTCSLLSVI